jgi:phosphoglycolate phosphatase
MPHSSSGPARPVHEASAVLIDLDGTLLDTAADLAAAVNLMLSDLQRPLLTQEQVAACVGKGSEVLVHRVLTGRPDGHAPEPEHAHAMQRFLLHYQSTNGQHAVPYPGVREGIEAMLSAGLRLACVTNKPQAFAEPLLARLDLADCFEFIQGGDALPFKKPDPRPLLHAAARLDSAPHLTVAVGDSINDAQAARAAGMTVFIVPYGYNEGVRVQSLDVDAIVDSLLDAARRVRLYRPKPGGQP